MAGDTILMRAWDTPLCPVRHRCSCDEVCVKVCGSHAGATMAPQCRNEAGNIHTCVLMRARREAGQLDAQFKGALPGVQEWATQ